MTETLAPPRVAFGREELTAAFLDEAEPLLLAHWREVAHYPDIGLAVDRSVYLAAEQAGILRLYTARSPRLIWHRISEGPEIVLQAPHLLGYAVFFVRPNPHYMGSLQAVQDVIYVSPESRGTTGARLIRYCDEQLAGEGVQAVYHHVKARHNFGPLLERMGYELVDYVYARRLDH